MEEFRIRHSNGKAIRGCGDSPVNLCGHFVEVKRLRAHNRELDVHISCRIISTLVDYTPIGVPCTQAMMYQRELYRAVRVRFGVDVALVYKTWTGGNHGQGRFQAEPGDHRQPEHRLITLQIR